MATLVTVPRRPRPSSPSSLFSYGIVSFISR